MKGRMRRTDSFITPGRGRACRTVALAGFLMCGIALRTTGEDGDRIALIAERTAIQPASTFTLAVEILTQKGWHTYWVNPGDSGMPPSLRWQLPEGVRLTGVRYPFPMRFEEQGLVSLGYEDRVWLLADFEADARLAAGEIGVGLSAEWLVCREVCLPVKGTADVRLDVAAEPVSPESVSAASFADWRGRLPARADGWTVTARIERRGVRMTVQPTAADEVSMRTDAWQDAQFYPVRRGAVALLPRQRWRRTRSGWETLLPAGAEPYKGGEHMEGVLIVPAGAADAGVGARAWRLRAQTQAR